MTVIVSRPTTSKPVLPITHTERCLNSNPINRIAALVAGFIAPKVKQVSPEAKTEAAPVPVALAPVALAPAALAPVAPVPAGVAGVAGVAAPSLLTLKVPTLPAEMFAIELPGQQDKDESDVPMWGFDEELTEAEAHMLETMREWTKAQTDPLLRARLEGWYNLRYNVDRFFHGSFTLEDAVAGWGKDEAPARYAAVETIASMFPSFVPACYYKKAGFETPAQTVITIPTKGVSSPAVADAEAEDDTDSIDPIARTESERAILDLFRHLSEEEQGYLTDAALDAENRTVAMRDGKETTTNHHRTMVEFTEWLSKVHLDQFLIPELRGNDLTANQNKRLDCAWELITGVFAEAETAEDTEDVSARESAEASNSKDNSVKEADADKQ